MPSLNEWWKKHPELHNKPEAEIVKAFLSSHKGNASKANRLFLEKEKLEDQIRRLKRNK